MTHGSRWWDGPWPWLFYLVTYGIPWLWQAPTPTQALLSGCGLALFLLVYLFSFRVAGRALAGSVLALVTIGSALMPVGGGWSILAVYPAMQAARLRPRRRATWLLAFCIGAFFVVGMASGQPLVWWLPSLMIAILIGGGGISREALYDHTRALLATQEEVRRLAGAVERERMARDVHDVVGRTLTLVALKADLVGKLAARDPEAALAEAHGIGEQARAGLAELRAALAGHAQGSLAGEMVASVAALRTAGVEADTYGDTVAIAPDAGAVLAMTLREAVTNVIRHAGARHCKIEVALDARMVQLTVLDDGSSGGIVEGQGLTGMRQRLVAAGGELSISDAGPGTRLVARVPS